MARPISTNVPPDAPSVTVCHIRKDGGMHATRVRAAVFSDWQTADGRVRGRYIESKGGHTSTWSPSMAVKVKHFACA